MILNHIILVILRLISLNLLLVVDHHLNNVQQLYQLLFSTKILLLNFFFTVLLQRSQVWSNFENVLGLFYDLQKSLLLLLWVPCKSLNARPIFIIEFLEKEWVELLNLLIQYILYFQLNNLFTIEIIFIFLLHLQF